MNAKTAGHFYRGAKAYVVGHKVISIVGIVVILGGGWWVYSKATSPAGEVRYVLGEAATTTIISTVSASGQVSTSDSIDIKPKASGEVTWIGVKAGDKVTQGQALVSLDSTDALQTLASAKKTLAADTLNFQKAQAQAPLDYQNDQQALQNAKDSLANEYNDTFNDLSNTYLDLPAIMTAALNTLYGYDFDNKKVQWNMDFLTNILPGSAPLDTVLSFKTSAKNDYTSAKASYDATVLVYKNTSRTSAPAVVDSLLAQSITMASAAAQALQSELNFLGAVSDLAQTYSVSLPSGFSTLQSTARSNLSAINSNLSTLLADKKTIDSAKQSIINAQQALTLDQVGNPNGSNPISLQVSQNSLEREEQDIANQQTALLDYTVRAPFAGTISAVNVKKGDTAGSAAVATIISSSQIAKLSLNEVDAAKIALGNKATLTFDAVDNLTLTGTVVQIDSVGSVSQGVVSYSVEISFDSQDARVKSGMTVNATIQTAVKQNVLSVPSSAVKTVSGQSFVQIFEPARTDTGGGQGVTSVTPPTLVPVEVGISDDTNTEIISGVTPGQQIVVSTRTSSATSATTIRATPSSTRSFGGGAAGNATFIQRF